MFPFMWSFCSSGERQTGREYTRERVTSGHDKCHKGNKEGEKTVWLWVCLWRGTGALFWMGWSVKASLSKNCVKGGRKSLQNSSFLAEETASVKQCEWMGKSGEERWEVRSGGRFPVHQLRHIVTWAFALSVVGRNWWVLNGKVTWSDFHF